MRALGWKVEENSRKYYDKQFSVIRAAKDQAKSPPSSPASQQQTQPPQPADLPEVSDSPPSSEQDNVMKEHLNIGNFKLVLKCSDRQVLQLSKQQLCSFFKSRNEVNTTNHTQEGPRLKINYLAAKPPPPPTFKYSREELLMISENPQSKVTDNLKVGTIIAN